MGTVTSYTAAKVAELMDEQIVDATAVGDQLTFTTRGGTDLDPITMPAGPEGPEGEVSSADLTAAIAADASDTGRGMIALDTVTTEQTSAFSDDDWIDITGLSITTTLVLGRMYEIQAHASLLSFADDTAFDLLIVTTSGTSIARGSGFVSDNNRTVGITATRKLLLPSGLDVSRTYKVQFRANTDFEVNVKSDVYASWLSIVDLGTV